MITFFDAFITIEFIWHSAIIIVNLCWSYAFHVTRQVLSRTYNFPSVVYFEMLDYTFWSSGSSLHIIYIKRQEKNFDVSLLWDVFVSRAIIDKLITRYFLISYVSVSFLGLFLLASRVPPHRAVPPDGKNKQEKTIRCKNYITFTIYYKVVVSYQKYLVKSI